MQTTTEFAIRDDLKGFACKDIAGSTLRVTPAKFLPDELCECLPGWHGNGINCSKCPRDTFSDHMGQVLCQPCPANSTSPEGAASKVQCNCKVGRLYGSSCGCAPQHALQGDSCVPCSELHLQCNQPGSVASTALPQEGHARLQPLATVAHKCHPPAKARCPGDRTCGEGYTGTLCVSCTEGFWATGSKCQRLDTNFIVFSSIGLPGVCTRMYLERS